MEWFKSFFHQGGRDKSTTDSNGINDHKQKQKPVQPLLINTVPGSTRHKDQGLDWYRAGLQYDEDGDEAHGFIMCDDKGEDEQQS